MTNPRRAVAQDQRAEAGERPKINAAIRARLRMPQSFRRQWLGIGRSLFIVVVACLFALVLVCVLVFVQGGYTDARQVGAIVVLNGDCVQASDANNALCPQEQMLDYALDLYRRGYAQHLLMLSNNAGATAVGNYLQEHSFPAQALLLEDQGTTQWQQIRRASDMARSNGINSVLLVGTPQQMLLGLKMTHDLGLSAFAAPLPTHDSGIVATVREVFLEAIAYWRYVLLGQ